MVKRREYGVERSTCPQHSQAFRQSSTRIANMLQHVVTDNAIEAIRGQRQALPSARFKGCCDPMETGETAPFFTLPVAGFNAGYRSRTQLCVSDRPAAVAAAKIENILIRERKRRKPFQKTTAQF